MHDCHYYACFDFHLRSAIALPELIAVDRPADPASIVDIRLGTLPQILPATREIGYGLQVSDDAAMLSVNNIARFRIRGGSEIVVDPLPGASERNVRLFLLGSALGVLCHQRGALLLHANAIVTPDGAFAFAGDSGAGKSTLAAHFERAGYEILCDDVCMIRFDAAGKPFAWPGLPRLKLWGDAAEAFGYDRGALDVAVDGMDKYHVPFARRIASRQILFRRLYLLEQAEAGEEGGFTRLRGMAAMEALLAQSYRSQYLEPMGLKMHHFRQCAALLDHIEVYGASRAWGYDVFDREAGRLERHLAEAG